MLVRMAARNLFRHRWRTTATVLGVALGIAAVLATLSVGENVEANVRSTLEAAAGRAALLVTPGAEGRAVFESAGPREVAADVPGVRAVYPVLNIRAEPVRELAEFEASTIPGVDTGFQLSGRVTEAPLDLPAELLQGALPEAGSSGVAIADGFARIRNIAIGDELVFATRVGDVPFTVTGLLDSSIGYATTNGGRVGIVHIDDLRSVLSLAGRASFLEIMLEPDAGLEDVQGELEDRIAEAFGPGLAVALPAGSGNIARGVIETIQSGLLVLAAALLALGGFMAYNTFTASVVERTREYALLRTICMTRGDVQKLALIEAALVSALGVVSGILLGILFSYAITRINAVALGFEFRTLAIPLWSVVIASVSGAAIALFAGSLPARVASRTPPLAALRDSEGPASGRYAGLGIVLAAAGVGAAILPWQGLWALFGAAFAMTLFFVGIAMAAPALLAPVVRVLGRPLTWLFGTAGKLGAGFTERNAARNGVAIGSVIVGTGLVIGVGAMVAGINDAVRGWVETTVVGDLFVTAPVSFPADFAQEAAGVSGVDVVSGVGIRVVRFEPEGAERGRSVALVLVDPERFDPETGFGRFQYIQGQGTPDAGYAALRDGTGVLAANTMLERFGVGAGDTVSLRTNEGFAEFPVAGVVVDFTGGGETFVASIDIVDRFGGGTPDLFVMTVAPGADPAAVRERLLETFPQLYLDVTLNAAYRDRILTLTQQSFATTNALLVLAVIIAALGVANTLGMNLAGRQREIALLRTLGLTRGGVRSLVSAEGIVIVAVGGVLGVGFGLLLAGVVTAGASALTGYVLTPVIPWRLVVVALIAAPGFGFIASLLPARRAASLSPLLALDPQEP